jgi:hypothetical protein
MLTIVLNSVYLYEIAMGSGTQIEILGIWVIQIGISFVFPIYLGHYITTGSIRLVQVIPSLILFSLPPSQLARDVVVFTGYIYNESLLTSWLLLSILSILLFVIGYTLSYIKVKINNNYTAN